MRKRGKLGVGEINRASAPNPTKPEDRKRMVALSSKGFFEGTCNTCPPGQQRFLLVRFNGGMHSRSCAVCTGDYPADGPAARQE